MKEIANLDDVTRSLDTVAKILRVLKKAGANMDDLQEIVQDIGKRDNLVKYLKSGCPEIIKKRFLCKPTYELASLLLGENFIFPEKIVAVTASEYTKQQLKYLKNNLPDVVVLSWLRERNYILLPTSAVPMNFLEVTNDYKVIFPGFPSRETYEKKCLKANELKPAEWLAVRKGVFPDSKSLSWKNQRDLLLSEERVPNETEIAWAIHVFCKLELMFAKHFYYVRTSTTFDSTAFDTGNQLTLAFYNNGFEIGSVRNDLIRDPLYVSSAWKL